MTLSELKPNQTAVVEGFTSNRSPVLRLQEQGMVTGSVVEMVRRAPLGDPIEVSLYNSHITLRHTEASSIEIRLHPAG